MLWAVGSVFDVASRLPLSVVVHIAPPAFAQPGSMWRVHKRGKEPHRFVPRGLKGRTEVHLTGGHEEDDVAKGSETMACIILSRPLTGMFAQVWGYPDANWIYAFPGARFTGIDPFVFQPAQMINVVSSILIPQRPSFRA